MTKEGKLKKKSTLGGLALVGFICMSIPLAQAKMNNNVPIQDLTLVQESSTKGITAKKDHDDHHHHHHHDHHHHWHHHHHDHHHHWHHHGVSGVRSGTELPSPKVDVKQ